MSLLPSIMAAQATSHPPSASKPFPLPLNLHRNPGKVVAPSPSRGALGAVDCNTGFQAIRPATAIPRPALRPDVFAATSPRASRLNTSFSQQSKRSRESSNTTVAKRPRDDAAERTRAHKQAEEKWISKWLKVFPTLVVHFEAGLDDGVGRALKQKVVKLGASVDPFFSHNVTHLIVKGIGRDSHLAKQADDMGIKVWDLHKLDGIISRIAPVELAAADTLRTLLEDERVHGTRERDLSAPRADYYYFKPGNKYTLIEDAVGRHRPIMVKEYSGAEWPTLYETFLRISASNVTDTPIDKLRERAWSLYVEGKEFGEERPPGELRRTTSMRNIAGTPSLPDVAPYQAASGNSVVISSNIASTSNANPSPFANDFRATLQLSKRVQVLRGNARLAAKRNQPNDLFAPTERRASTGTPVPQKTFMTQDQVVSMLRQAREPVAEATVSKEMRIANHARAYGEIRREEAQGYCENCRLRYTELDMHLASKKHRRFAYNKQNFMELDQLLSELRRPGSGAEETELDTEGEDSGEESE